MTMLPTFRKPTLRLVQPESIDELLRKAMEYGHIYLYQHQTGRFVFSITFRTPAGTNLEAKSGHEHKTPESAIKEALANAEKIKAAFK